MKGKSSIWKLVAIYSDKRICFVRGGYCYTSKQAMFTQLFFLFHVEQIKVFNTVGLDFDQVEEMPRLLAESSVGKVLPQKHYLTLSVTSR